MHNSTRVLFFWWSRFGGRGGIGGVAQQLFEEERESEGPLSLGWVADSAGSAELSVVAEPSICFLRSSLSFSLACKYSAETKIWGESFLLKDSCILGALLSASASLASFSSDSLRFSLLLSVCGSVLSVLFLLSALCLLNWQSSWYHCTAVSFSANRSSYYGALETKEKPLCE